MINILALLAAFGPMWGQPASDSPASIAPTPPSMPPSTPPSTPPATPPASQPATIDDLITLMTGSFTSQRQAAGDPDFFDIRLHMTRIWPSERNGAWLYVEQARSDTLDKPYRQRIYFVTPMTFTGGDGLAHTVFRSEVWLLPGDPLAFAGAWADPSRLDALSPTSLSQKSGCEVLLVPGGGNTFAGSTLGRGCPSERGGATFTTSEVTITSTGLESWDRGFDAGGKQVWGAEKGGYLFLRETPEK